MTTTIVRLTFGICAILLCLAFFVAPLVSMSGGMGGGVLPLVGDLVRFGFSVTGFQFAMGTADIHVDFLGMGLPVGTFEQLIPAMFILLAAPILLAIFAFVGKSLKILFILSIAGLVVQIGFMAITGAVLLQIGTLRFIGISIDFTAFAWLIAAVYIALIFLSLYGLGLKKKVAVVGGNMPQLRRFCTSCGKALKATGRFCTGCGKQI